ncbi:MAG: endonuclease/exonuclease/phosphatase family protein [bacterium]
MPKKILFLLLLILTSCDPLVDTIPEVRECVNFEKNNVVSAPAKDTISVMTWNIRFGCGSEILWFGDACGSRTVLKKSEVVEYLDLIIEEINTIKPDILFLQEVDLFSKRSAYIDQMQYILDRTYFKYAIFGTDWNIQFVPSDGNGRVNEGDAIFSVWPLSERTLYPLPLRNDLDALTKYFYVRETVISCKVQMPGGTNFYAVNTHLSAYSTDDTKYRQLERYVKICDSLSAKGLPLVTGGDYNLIPPNSDSTDYCDEDKCTSEHFHGAGDIPLHKEGSNYLPEIDWLNLLYDKYIPSLPLSTYKANQSSYFTHTTDPNMFWDRTLDYLFANRPWVENSHKAHQDLRKHSDHAPISALWRVK